VKTGNQPFALDVEHGRTVWVTLLAGGTVQPVRFTR
jgi:hypothetical protein